MTDLNRREWAPYAAQHIAEHGTIPRPAERRGARWVLCGGFTGGPHVRTVRSELVYRVVPLAEYQSPDPRLPLPYQRHCHLPDTHPYRYGYEGMIVTHGGAQFVLTDEHATFGHPYIANPAGGFRPDPDWTPKDEDAVRTERSPLYNTTLPETVKRMDLSGTLIDTFQTEVELDGHRKAQGRLFDRGAVRHHEPPRDHRQGALL